SIVLRPSLRHSVTPSLLLPHTPPAAQRDGPRATRRRRRRPRYPGNKRPACRQHALAAYEECPVDCSRPQESPHALPPSAVRAPAAPPAPPPPLPPPPPCPAMWRMPTEVPVGRLVTNLPSYTREHPDDAEGFYLLGRVHGLAFVERQRVISVWPNRERTD